MTKIQTAVYFCRFTSVHSPGTQRTPSELNERAPTPFDSAHSPSPGARLSRVRREWEVTRYATIEVHQTRARHIQEQVRPTLRLRPLIYEKYTIQLGRFSLPCDRVHHVTSGSIDGCINVIVQSINSASTVALNRNRAIWSAQMRDRSRLLCGRSVSTWPCPPLATVACHGHTSVDLLP